MQNQTSSRFQFAAPDAAKGILLWGGVKCNYQSDTCGDNPASAALEKGAAFFVCANNSKNSIAMIKNNFNELGTYVSPAVKVAQINPRRVMCQSPYGELGAAGAYGSYIDETIGDENDY